MGDFIVPIGGSTRQPRHWNTDLVNARASELEVRRLLTTEPAIESVCDRSATLESVDFAVASPGLRFGVEVKSKRQSYKAAAIVAPSIPEPHQMILDEAHLRGAFHVGGIFVVVIHDLPGGLWHLYSCWTLLLCEKHRWEREAHRQVDFRKAKVTVDLRAADLSRPMITGRQIVDLARRADEARSQTEAWHA
jgi:hypothetical protein